jgi:hypothetical protein
MILVLAPQFGPGMYPEKTTDLQQVTDNLYGIMLYHEARGLYIFVNVK